MIKGVGIQYMQRWKDQNHRAVIVTRQSLLESEEESYKEMKSMRSHKLKFKRLITDTLYTVQTVTVW